MPKKNTRVLLLTRISNESRFDEGVAEDRLLERWGCSSRFLTAREKHRHRYRLPNGFGRFKQEAEA